MGKKHPNPDDDYWEQRFSDPDDQEDLEESEEDYDYDEDSTKPGWLSKSGLLKIIAAFMGLLLIGSMLMPVIGPLIRGGGSPQSSTDSISQELRSYEQWIGSRVRDVLVRSNAARHASFLGVQFDNSIQRPIVGILVSDQQPTGDLSTMTMQSSSIEIFQRLFEDDRAQDITLAWLKPGEANPDGQITAAPIFIVGMLRQTAQALDWSRIKPEDLESIADFYQEVEPPKGLTASMGLMKTPSRSSQMALVTNVRSW